MTQNLAALRGPFAGTAGHLDAPYWPTPSEVVEAMLDLAAIRRGEHLLDLGCGDGRIVVAAAQRGAKGLGVDIDPLRVAEAEAAARTAGVSSRARFSQEDLFETPLGAADVISLYLLHHVNGWLRPRLAAEARPGTRIVSHAFGFEGWEPVAARQIGRTALYMWIVGS